MSDRKWGIISALAGLAALVTSAGFGAFYGSVYAPTNEPYHSITANGGQTYPSDSPRNGLADVAGINSVVQSAIAKPQPRNTYEREQRDLAAQESMAVFAYWMFVAVVFQSLFALGALFALLKDLRQNRDSAQQQLRAYVAFKLRPDTKIEPETPIFVSLDVMNYGQTPARNVEFQYATAYNPRDWAWEKDADATRTNSSSVDIHNGVPLHTAIDTGECLSDQQWEQIGQSEMAFFARGIVYYDDVFGRSHLTQITLELRAEELGERKLRISPHGCFST